MSDTYTAVMENQTIVADATLVILRAATAWSSRASLLEVLRVEVGQSGTSTSQELGIIMAQKASAFGAYTSTTPTPKNVGGVASGITGSTSAAAASCGTDASSEGAGTVTAGPVQGFNNLNGFLWVATPEERIWIGPDLAWIVKLRGTPTTLTGWHAYVTFREAN